MSLIQEALRRQQEEMERSKEGSSDTRPPDGPPAVPEPAEPPKPPDSGKPLQVPPIPDPPPDRKKGGKAKHLLPLLGMFFFIFVLIAAVAYLGWFLFDRFKEHIPEIAGGPEEPSAAVVVQQPAGAEAGHEPKTIYGKMVRKAEDAVTDTAKRVDTTFDVEKPAQPVAPSVVEPEPPKKPVAVVKPKQEPPKPAPVPVKPKPAPEPAQVQEPPAKPLSPVDWPVLKVTGVLASDRKGGGSALVNGNVIFVGQEINGATLISVNSDGALFRCEHETNFFGTVSSF